MKRYACLLANLMLGEDVRPRDSFGRPRVESELGQNSTASKPEGKACLFIEHNSYIWVIQRA